MSTAAAMNCAGSSPAERDSVRCDDWLGDAVELQPRVSGTTPGGGERAESVHFSSETVEWPTPQWLFDALNAEFGFTLDPCSTHENAKCAKHYTRAENGLLKSWESEVVWMNPPYGAEIAAWMAKAHGAAMNEGATVVCLVPARTDTAWWHGYAMKHEIRLLRGRLTFEGATSGAPFPSAVVVMRPASFRLVGWAVGDSASDRERKSPSGVRSATANERRDHD